VHNDAKSNKEKDKIKNHQENNIGRARQPQIKS
jgi:hypothetical protein